VAVVATCREVPIYLVQRGPVDLLGSPVAVCCLRGLTADETGSLVSDILATGVSDELARWVHSHTGGNALFVDELTRYLCAQGRLSNSTAGAVLVSGRSAVTSLPPTLTSVLADRLAELDSEELTIVELVALGPGSEPWALARASATTEERVRSIAESLHARGLLERSPATDDLSVAHGLLREAVIDQVPMERRQELHRLMADIWDSASEPAVPGCKRDSVLGWHLWRAGLGVRAAPHVLAAAGVFLDRGQAEQCLAYLDIGTAIAGSGQLDADSLRGLARGLADLYWTIGRGAASANAYRIAVECAAVSPDCAWTESLELHWGLGRACLRSGDAAGAHEALERAAAISRAHGDDIWLARVEAGLAAVHQMRGEFRETDRLADESLHLLESTSLDDAKARACMAKGNALVSLCAWQCARLWYSRAAEHARRARDEAAVRGATCNLGLAHLNLGEWAEAEQHFNDALVPARAQGCAYSIALALNNSGILWTRRGALDEASGRLWEAVKWFEECGDNWGLALAYSNIGELEHIRGNDHAAQDLFARSEDLMSKAGSVDDLPELYRRRGESLAALEQDDEAAAVLERAREMAGTMGNTLEAANCARVLGDLAARSGADARAAALCDESVAALRSLGAPYEQARSLASLGRVLAKMGARDRATAAAEEAQAIFADLGARRDLRALQEETLFLSRGEQPPVHQLPDERGRLAALYRSSACLAAAETLDALSRELADIVAAGIPVDVAATVMLNEDGGVSAAMSSMCGHGEDADEVASLASVLLASSEGSPATVALEVGSAGPTLAPLLKARGLRRVLLVPMVSAKRRIGALYMDYRSRDGRFSDEDVRFVEALASQGATAIENVQLRREMADEIESLRWEVDGRYSYSNIIGRSLPMQRLFVLIQKVARSSVTVLVEGESGTGKELVARAIHFNGPRRKARFIAQNCAALPEQLLESELFGHVRGAFTGALRDKPGLFEAASGGTFFLDEIADMPVSLQVKLLRVLQDGEIRRVGATDPVTVDVRIVAATNKSLEEEVKAGRFREDLYYRLNVVRVVMPPLRERRDDIPLLAQHFLNRFADDADDGPRGFTDHAMDLLVNYAWPGNVRELENEIERAVALAKPGAPIGASALSDRIRSVQVAIRPLRPGSQLSLKDMVEDVERRVILQVLNECDWNKSRASAALGLSRQGLLKKIARFGLEQAEE
jgi:Nif-specific regulatory protein